MPETLGACLQAWMEEEGLTVIMVAEMAGYKSRTSVIRLLRENCEENTRQQFYEAIRMKLNQKWKERFQRALSVSRVGAERYAMYEALREELFKTPQKWDTDSRNRNDPDGAMLCILGCAWEETAKWIEDRRAECPWIQIRHYMIEEEILTSPGQAELLLRHLLDPAYEAYAVDVQAVRDAKLPWNISFCRGFGRKSFFLYGNARWHRVPAEAADEESVMTRLDSLEKKRLYQNAKLTSGTDYMAFLKRNYSMELNRRVAGIRMTPGVQMMPYETLCTGFEEYMNLAKDPISLWKEAFFAVQEKRNRNFFHRKKGTLLIFSKAAMKQLARTGNYPDSFYAIRAFDKDELSRIFEELLAFSRKENVRLLTRDGDEPGFSLETYEDWGTLIYPSRTSYDTSREPYRELILPGKNSDGFFNTFVEEISRDENVEAIQPLLRDLIAIVKAQSGS